MFELDSQLERDTFLVCELDLCTLRLMNNSAVPWLILVPRRDGMRDIIDLSEIDQLQLAREIARASIALKAVVNPVKLNVAALGNVVPQLHIHVIARFENDLAWPKPVWGNLPDMPYAAGAERLLIKQLIEPLSKKS